MKYFFLFLSLFAVLACGSDGSYTGDGDSNWACYSPQSGIYNAELNNAEPNDLIRSPAAMHTVKFKDNDSIIYEVTVPEEDFITFPDIRAKHCFHGRENQVLLGWNDTGDNYTTGGIYKVTKDVTFTSVWGEGAEIYSAAELSAIRDNLTKTYKLMRNIDLKDNKTRPGWIPIGDDSAQFSGKLYGNGYRIDNLTIDNSTGSAAGLFGAIGGSAEIYDLSINLSDSGISLTTPNTDKAIGALAGSILYDGDSNIIIRNVQTSGGKITADNCSTSGDRYLYIGGLVGGAVASDPSSLGGSAKITLDNLSNSIPVSIESVADCSVNLGGIIGKGGKIALTAGANRGVVNAKAGNSIIYSGGVAGYLEENSSIDSCSNDSTDNITAESTNGDASSGGIAGFMNGGTIKNSRNADNVTSTSASNFAFAGGIVGNMDSGTIENDNNTGYVEAKAISIAHSGGIAGKIINGTLENDNNNGDVYAKSDGDAYSGGIAGNMDGGTIKNDNNNGDVSAESDGDAYSGGIVGNMDSGTITNSRNTDNVTATSTSNYAYSGGIVGYMSSGTIENDNNIGKVKAKSDNSDAYSGGIVGIVYMYGTTATATINNNSNIGAVKTESEYAYSGGIAGKVYLSMGGFGSATATATMSKNSNIGKVEADASSGDSSSGGIAGFVELFGGAAATATIDNCSNTGSDNISAISKSDSSSRSVCSGGIVGNLSGGGSITNSRNTDNVTATSEYTSNSSSSYAGGIVGYTTGSTISNDSNTGKVEASGSYTVSSGGVAGYTTNSKIENSRNLEDVTATSTSTFPSAFVYSGGIVGYLRSSSSIETSYNGGRVNAESTAIDACSGGIAGYIHVGTSLVEDSYNTGAVTAIATDTTSGNAYSGGISGRVDSFGGISNSYNTGDVAAATNGTSSNAYSGGISGWADSYGGISNSYNTGDVAATTNGTSGIPYSGGIVGELSSTYSTVGQCAAVDGKISSIGATPKIGKIVGLVSGGSALDNFALDPMTLTPTITTGENGTAKTETDFKTPNTYTDSPLSWDFTPTGIWAWDNVNELPILKWQN
jgi:hypothetical protein